MSPLRVLALAPFPPRLDGRHGGSRAIAELLAGLGARHRIALFALQGADEPPVDDALRARCELVREIARPPRAEETLASDLRVSLALARGTPLWVSRWSVPSFRQELAAFAGDWHPHVVHAEFHVMAQYFGAVPHRPARVLRLHDPGVSGAAERTRASRRGGRLLGALEHRAWRRYESRAMADADVVTALSPQDRAVLTPLAGAKPLLVVPLGVPLPERAADPLGRHPMLILFVGNFVHPPNGDAATRLVRSIAPLIRLRLPAAEVRIVGPNPPPELVAAAGPGVTFTGEVPDVRPHLEDAAVVIAPIRQGGGMRVKVAEALAAGKAVVSTTLAAGGLHVLHENQLLLADTDEELADATATLLGDADRRAALAGRARAWALASLGWDGPVEAYERIYRSLCDEGGP